MQIYANVILILSFSNFPNHIYIQVHVHTQTLTDTISKVHSHTYMHIHIYLYMCVYVCVYLKFCMCMYIYIYVCVCVCMHTFTVLISKCINILIEKWVFHFFQKFHETYKQFLLLFFFKFQICTIFICFHVPNVYVYIHPFFLNKHIHTYIHTYIHPILFFACVRYQYSNTNMQLYKHTVKYDFLSISMLYTLTHTLFSNLVITFQSNTFWGECIHVYICISTK